MAMAVLTRGMIFEGLSTDTKPTTGVGPNAVFMERDTGMHYNWSGSAWVGPLLWDDLRTPVNLVRVPPAQPPTWVDYKGSQVLSFADQAVEANEERVYLALQMPHNWAEGTFIVCHVHFVPEDDTGGNVRWLLTYSWANQDSGAFPAETTLAVDAACGTVADAHKYAEFPDIVADAVGKLISSMLLCRLQRNSSHANDTYNGKSAYLLEFDVHYQVDSFGSRQEMIK